MKRGLIYISILFILPIIVNAAEIPNINNYLTYYGSNELNNIIQFDLAFLESNNYQSSDIQFIKDSGTLPICYVSIGEDDELHVGDGSGPGGYASWYLDADNNNQPDKNLQWGSYYVNASDLNWQNRILNDITETIINQKGCSGLFLDTIDTVELYPSTESGMISLIQQLDQKYFNSYLVANRGFVIMEEISPYLDGVMFESFSSRLVSGNTYAAWQGVDLDWTSSQALTLLEIKQLNPFTIFALDYSQPTDQTLIDYDYNRALDFNFIPYVSTILLDQIYFHTYTRIPGLIPDGYTDNIGDVSASYLDITSVTASNDDINFNLAINLNDVPSNLAYYDAFIDINRDDDTGYRVNLIGAEYLIENGNLYSYTGSGNDWSWQFIKLISETRNSNTISWSLLLSDINEFPGSDASLVFSASRLSDEDVTVKAKYIFSGGSTTTTTSTTTSTSIISSTTTTTIPIQTFYLIPTTAIDQSGIEQISPDSGSLDGTVDLNNDDSRWLTNENDYIEVSSWNAQIQDTSIVNAATAYCDIQFVNPKSGNIEFSFNTGSGWSSWICSQTATQQTTFSCNLFNQGVDTPIEINNLDLRCRLHKTGTGGGWGFAVDYIYLSTTISGSSTTTTSTTTSTTTTTIPSGPGKGKGKNIDDTLSLAINNLESLIYHK